jgi:heme A synthase
MRPMDWAGWAIFGFVATVVLTGIMVGAQLAGLSRMDLPMMLGTVFVESPDGARVIGFLVVAQF